MTPEIRGIIEGARDQILWNAVRYDKSQFVAPWNTTDDERGTTRDNPNCPARWDLPAMPDLNGVMCYNRNQYYDISDEQAAMVRNALRV